MRKIRNCLKCGKFTGNPKFCDRSCSASYNNKKSPKRKRTARRYTCLFCENKLEGSSKKYCDNKCQQEWYYYNVTVPKIETGQVTEVRTIRRYLIERDGNFCKECEILPIWNGKELQFHVDHVDGDRNNNLPKNLRFLCPNCHSQTETYSGRNIKGKIVSDVDLSNALLEEETIADALKRLGLVLNGRTYKRCYELKVAQGK